MKTKTPDKFNWFWLTFLHTAGISGAISYYFIDGRFDLTLVALFLGFFTLAGISITAGYHRLFSHRAFQAHPIVQFLLLVFGATAFQNSCLKWSTDHRRHHTHADKDLDPYNINEGFMWAHMGWIVNQDPHIERFPFPKDLLANRMVMFQHKYYIAIAILFGIILPALIGLALGNFWGGLLIGGLFKIVAIHHSTFFINSLAHVWGRKPFDEKSTARDNGWIAFLTFGEGYHNFHHRFQTDYRNGIRWYDFDPTKWLILVLAKLGLATNLKSTPWEEIFRAKVNKDWEQLPSHKQEQLAHVYDSLVGHFALLKQKSKEAPGIITHQYLYQAYRHWQRQCVAA